MHFPDVWILYPTKTMTKDIVMLPDNMFINLIDTDLQQNE